MVINDGDDYYTYVYMRILMHIYIHMHIRIYTHKHTYTPHLYTIYYYFIKLLYSYNKYIYMRIRVVEFIKMNSHSKIIIIYLALQILKHFFFLFYLTNWKLIMILILKFKIFY